VPLWVVVFEFLRPKGEKPGAIVLAGLLAGAVGVGLLVAPRLSAGFDSGRTLGTALLLLSALLFAVGSIFVRHYPPDGDAVRSSMWMMIFGGGYLIFLGAVLGEFGQITGADFGWKTVSAFLFLLLVHSLGAFTAMNWLLRHLPASIVTTKFFVSPAVAVLAGWLVLGETVGLETLASLFLILVGVGVVFWGRSRLVED
jgi:drug/metabolite transporter (DMT)-like permease